ncbi:MAG: D-alanyl-D-alanine carboxypeptidase/D-alanyl-D-alanine-endopeptidase [Myxococcota bacterium]
MQRDQQTTQRDEQTGPGPAPRSLPRWSLAILAAIAVSVCLPAVALVVPHASYAQDEGEGGDAEGEAPGDVPGDNGGVADADAPARGAPAPAEHVEVASALASLANSWLFRKADAGLAVIDLETGERVFELGSTKLLNPASTMKVVTSATALKNLGPAYRFTTDLYYTGDIEPNGVLRGDLYIKGHGDPTFVSETMWKMVNDIELMGVERIDGTVYFDDTFHSGGPVLPGWDKQEDIDKGTSYFATLSALSINSNTVVLVVRPGAEVGGQARVELETPVRGNVEIDNQVRTGPPRSRRYVDVEREVLPNEDTKFTLTGSLPVDDLNRVWIRRTVADPTGHFVAVFRKQMDQHGIRVSGGHKRRETPDDAKLLFSVRSEPLSQILASMNKSSLNFVAEQVLRTLGGEITGDGSTRGGLAVVAEYLRSIGVPEADAVLINGSGLSRQAKLKPTTLTSVLYDMAHDQKVGPEFAASLAIAGTDGTLYSRLREDPGRLRGKTGTLDGVHCLAGFIDSHGSAATRSPSSPTTTARACRPSETSTTPSPARCSSSAAG